MTNSISVGKYGIPRTFEHVNETASYVITIYKSKSTYEADGSTEVLVLFTAEEEGNVETRTLEVKQFIGLYGRSMALTEVEDEDEDEDGDRGSSLAAKMQGLRGLLKLASLLKDLHNETEEGEAKIKADGEDEGEELEIVDGPDDGSDCIDDEDDEDDCDDCDKINEKSTEESRKEEGDV